MDDWQKIMTIGLNMAFALKRVCRKYSSHYFHQCCTSFLKTLQPGLLLYYIYSCN